MKLIQTVEHHLQDMDNAIILFPPEQSTVFVIKKFSDADILSVKNEHRKCMEYPSLPILNILVQQLIFWYSLWRQGAIHDKLAFHGSPIYCLHIRNVSVSLHKEL